MGESTTVEQAKANFRRASEELRAADAAVNAFRERANAEYEPLITRREAAAQAMHQVTADLLDSLGLVPENEG